ncbi:MAG: hypothetical protein ACHQ50_08920 [Fimbriimonadales bacterium]
MIAGLALLLIAQSGEPVLVKDSEADISKLQAPGKILFTDGFEGAAPLSRFFEVRGEREGLARIAGIAHSGSHALELTAINKNGQSSGAGVSYWIGNQGYERLYLRYYVRFDPDYNQGNLNHTGAALTGMAGDDKWRGMGKAGIRPIGDDYFIASFETWRDWGRVQPPGYSFFYTYWMDMKRDKDGHFWGNMLGPDASSRRVIPRGRWTCCEIMVNLNKPGAFDGELAAWIDGQLYEHYCGMRWRSSPDVLLKRFGLDVYVHEARQDNTVFYDDVALSTGYIGPVKD